MAEIPPSPRKYPKKAEHFAHDPSHYNTTPRETLEEAKEEVKEKVGTVSKKELEDFLSQAVRLFLRGGAYLHHEGYGSPSIEFSLSDDTVVLDITDLARAVSERREIASEGDEPEDAPGEQVLDTWRVFLKLDGEVIAAFGRGIPGVQVRTGRASFLLFKDFVKGYLGEADARPPPPPSPDEAPTPEDIGVPVEPGTHDVPRKW